MLFIFPCCMRDRCPVSHWQPMLSYRHTEHHHYGLLSRSADSSMQGGSYLVISITGGHHMDIARMW